jgi:hypothetical protein
MDICRLIFEFDHQLEMYKPVARHRRVPRIADLVRRPAGKLDARADRKPGLLRVDAIHQDIPFGKTTSAAVREPDPGSGSLAGLDLKLPASAAPRTAHRQGVSGHPGFPWLPGAGAEDHRFCQGRVSGLTLS